MPTATGVRPGPYRPGDRSPAAPPADARLPGRYQARLTAQPRAPEPQSWACRAHRAARRHSRPSGRRPQGGRTAACPRWPPWKGLFPRSRFPQQLRTPPANVSCAACSREPWLGRATRGPRAAAAAPSRSARGRGSLPFLTSFSKAPAPGAPDPGRLWTGPHLYPSGWPGAPSVARRAGRDWGL